MRVGVIGLGSMGLGAALSALRSTTLTVVGCDPRPEACDAFAAAGGVAVGSAAALADGTEAVVVFTVDALQAEAALALAAPRLAADAVVVCCATVAPDAARGLGAWVAARGWSYLDAPVSGGAAAAAEARLTLMAAGSDAAFARATPLLDAIASKVWRLGPEPGMGSTMKVVHQLLAGVHIAAAAEAMALGIKAGLEPRTLYEVVVSAAGNSWMFENRMPHVLDADPTPRSAVNIFVKDLGLVGDLARGVAAAAPLAAAAHQMFVAARALGHGGVDDAYVIRAYQALSGITLPGDS